MRALDAHELRTVRTILWVHACYMHVMPGPDAYNIYNHSFIEDRHIMGHERGRHMLAIDESG